MDRLTTTRELIMNTTMTARTRQYSSDTPRAQFALPPDLLLQLQERTREDESISTKAREDLRRYYAMLEEGRAELAEKLTGDEVRCLSDELSAAKWDAGNIWELPDAVRARAEAISESWGSFDAGHFYRRIEALSPAARFALVDTIERNAIALGLPRKGD